MVSLISLPLEIYSISQRAGMKKTGLCRPSPKHPMKINQSLQFKIFFSVSENFMSCSFVRFALPFGCLPARRSFLFSYRRSMRASMLSAVYSKPFWFSTLAHRARHILASPQSCVTTRSPGFTRLTSAKSTLSAPLGTSCISVWENRHKTG